MHLSTSFPEISCTKSIKASNRMRLHEMFPKQQSSCCLIFENSHDSNQPTTSAALGWLQCTNIQIIQGIQNPSKIPRLSLWKSWCYSWSYMQCYEFATYIKRLWYNICYIKTVYIMNTYSLVHVFTNTKAPIFIWTLTPPAHTPHNIISVWFQCNQTISQSIYWVYASTET